MNFQVYSFGGKRICRTQITTTSRRASVAYNTYYVAKKQAFLDSVYKNLWNKRKKQQDKLIFGESLSTRLRKDKVRFVATDVKSNLSNNTMLPSVAKQSRTCGKTSQLLPRSATEGGFASFPSFPSAGKDGKDGKHAKYGKPPSDAKQKVAQLENKSVVSQTSFATTSIDNLENSKKTHSQSKKYNKVKFPGSKNLKLKQKVHYLHTFWRLNISDLNLSLKTQLLLKKLNINNVYDLHFFILKKSWSLFLNLEQQKEIIKIYLNWGLNSPF